MVERRPLLEAMESGVLKMAAGFGESHPLPQKAGAILKAFQNTSPAAGSGVVP